MKKCPFCAEEIQDEAIKCKHCWSDLIQKKSEKKQDTKWWFLSWCNKHPIWSIIIFFFVIVPFLSWILSWYKPDSTSPTPQIQSNIVTPESYLESNRWVAKMMCRDTIKLQLKAPKTASFDNEDVRFTWKKWEEAEAAWEVTSENSFWANLTNLYLCKFKWNWSDYSIVDAKIIQR